MLTEKLTNYTVILCSNYAWTIYNFRLPLIRKLKELGFKVIVLTQFDGFEKKLNKEVDIVLPLFISRNGVNPIIDTLTIIDLFRKIYQIKPHLVLFFTIKPVIYGSLVSSLLGINSIVTITGLGTSFIKNNWITKVVKFLYKFTLKHCSIIFFQNNSDKRLFEELSLVKKQVCKIIPGSGINLDLFKYSQPKNDKDLTFLLIARMLWDKGIGEFIGAAKIVKNEYPKTLFKLLGPIGVQNRTAVSNKQIIDWHNSSIIEYLGESTNVSEYIKNSSCVVLPSYREGISRVLLEASAIGRPMIASNVPGCREIVEDEINGFICRVKDINDLAEKIIRMIRLPFQQRIEMGVNARKKMHNEFSIDIVNKIYIENIFHVIKNKKN